MSSRSSGGTSVGACSFHGALAAPSFWAALALLALNDHLLKGSGICPSWLTGKLSDFAGLIVAPALAAELCPGRRERLQLCAAGLVVLAFVATEVSSGCAAAVEHAFAQFGVRVRLWPDPTDLAALVVLPWTWCLLRRPRVELRTTVLQRAGLAIAALTCAATSDAPDYVHGPFLVNHSGGRLRVEITWLEAPNACTATLAELANEPDALTPILDREYELSHERTQRLDLPSEPPDAGAAACLSHEPVRDPSVASPDAGAMAPPCVLLRIAGPELPDYLVRADATWTDSESSLCARRIRAYEDPGQGALVIGHGGDGERSLHAFKHVEAFKLAR